MEFFFILAIASAVSLAVIPVAVSLAPRLGLIDRPCERKIHTSPIPRVGGVGIVAGTLTGITLLLPVDNLIASYLAGTAILSVFGTLDDRFQLGHYAKFIGQFLAITPIVTWGGLYVTQIPFVSAQLPPAVGVPFTIFALIGMINAINHSDGLDGLAGGETILSLTGISLLALFAGDSSVALMALATIGSVAGFLRYNDYPARLFMGDSGSQFLGFTLGVLAILLTQRIDLSLSPAIVLLLLGLPIADILAVFFLRIRGRMNWFRATRNHVHHRLLNLGLTQRSAVLTIYSAQAVMVTSGILLRNQPNIVIVAVYLAICSLVFGGLYLAESKATSGSHLTGRRHSSLRIAALSRRVLAITIPAYLIGLAVTAPTASFEIAMACLAAAFLIPVEPILNSGNARSILSRALTYVVVTFIVYTSTVTRLDHGSASAEIWLLILIGVSVIAAAWSSPKRRRFEFQLTAVDLIVLAAILALSGLAIVWSIGNSVPLIEFMIKLALILYGVELLLVEQRNRYAPHSLLFAGAGTILAANALL